MKSLRAVAVLFAFVFLLPGATFADTVFKIPSKDLQADYDRVWGAAIDVLYEMHFPISFMSKGDGYIVTEKLENEIDVAASTVRGKRVRVTLRFVQEEGLTIVKILSDEDKMFWSNSFNVPNYRPFSVWEPAGSNTALEAILKEKLTAKTQLKQ